jgi:hypothetical protein
MNVQHDIKRAVILNPQLREKDLTSDDGSPNLLRIINEPLRGPSPRSG